MRTKAGKAVVAPVITTSSTPHTPNDKIPSSTMIRQQLQQKSAGAQPYPNGAAQQITQTQNKAARQQPISITGLGASQGGIRERPMSGTRLQGATQQLIKKSHRKSTSMTTTKELPIKQKMVKTQLNQSNYAILQQQMAVQQNTTSPTLTLNNDGNNGAIRQMAAIPAVATYKNSMKSPTLNDSSLSTTQRHQKLLQYNHNEESYQSNDEETKKFNPYAHSSESLRQRVTTQQDAEKQQQVTVIPLPTVAKLSQRRASNPQKAAPSTQRVGAASLRKQLTPSGKQPNSVVHPGAPASSFNARSTKQQVISGSRNIGLSATSAKTQQPSSKTQQHHHKLKSQQLQHLQMTATKHQYPRQRLLTPNLVSQVSAGTIAQHKTALYEPDSSHKLQHEIEASDDAPYKPGLNGFRHNQNKNSPVMIDSSSQYTTTSAIMKNQQRAKKGLLMARPQQQEHHFATEGNSDKGTIYLKNNADKKQLLSSSQMVQQKPNRFGQQTAANQIVTTTTSGNEDYCDEHTSQTVTIDNQYAKENQKIELSTKSYQGSAWCCQSSEIQYDQSQIDSSKKPANSIVYPPRPLTFKEKVVEMIGWGSCTKATPMNREQTLILDDMDEDEKIFTPLDGGNGTGGQQMTPQQPFTPRSIQLLSNAQTAASPMPKLKLTSPPTISHISIMPRTRRQQLGLTPQTNMRLFKCDDQVGRKSMLSNSSIVPCSEEDSFVSSGVKNCDPQGHSFTDPNKTNDQQPKLHSQSQQQNYPQNYPQSSTKNLSQYNAAKQAMMANASLQEERKKLNDSSHTYQLLDNNGVKSSKTINRLQMTPLKIRNKLQNLTIDHQSTHSYEYKSSIKNDSEPRAEGSIIEDLHALNINIQKREKELAMRAGSSNEELELKRLALINADSNSVNSQIPCESDGGGQTATATVVAYIVQQPVESSAQIDPPSSVPQKAADQASYEAVVGENLLASAPRSSKRSISVNFESVIMLENKLNRICKCLVMVKYAEEQASFQYTTERQLHHAIQNYQIQHEELIGLCEEYWTILRQEAYLFCQIPQRMFKDKPRLVSEIRKSFILKLLVVSQVGFLTSNEEFQFNDSLLREQLTTVCQSFLCFMRVMLGKLTPPMLQNFFWARKLHEIVKQKLHFINAQLPVHERRSDEQPEELTTSQATNELARVNAQTTEHLKSMFEEMESIRQDEELQDNSKYEHPIFQTVQEILVAVQTDSIEFKDASTLIGRSLVSEFSELDSADSVSGDDAVNNMRRNEAAGGQPMNAHVKIPFLPPLRGTKEYTLVLDLDETLVHYYEEKNTVLLRPYASQFLQQMAQFYEVVIFTAGTKDYADWALAHLQNQAAYLYIDHRLYRDHTIQCMDVFIKDLSNLGRDLDKTIIVDNITENFLLQPENGISIKSWFDDPDDTALVDLAPLLRQIVEQRVPDIRLALKESKEQLISAIASGEVNPTQRLKQLSFSDRSDNVSSNGRHRQAFNESEIDETNTATRNVKQEL